MAVSENKKKSNAAWDKANMERLTIKYRKGLTAEIKARAAELGKPVNRYIVDLIRQDIDANWEIIRYFPICATHILKCVV